MAGGTNGHPTGRQLNVMTRRPQQGVDGFARGRCQRQEETHQPLTPQQVDQPDEGEYRPERHGHDRQQEPGNQVGGHWNVRELIHEEHHHSRERQEEASCRRTDFNSEISTPEARLQLARGS